MNLCIHQRKFVKSGLICALLYGGSLLAAQEWTDESKFYAGVGLGYSVTPYALDLPPGDNVRGKTERGFAQRFFAGYDLREFAGVEIGYNHYAPTSVSTSQGESARSDLSALNLMLVLTTPHYYGLSAFAKLGEQYNMANLATSDTVGGIQANADYWRITYALGASYAFNPHVEAQFQWQQVPKVSSVSTDVSGVSYQAPRADLYTLGLRVNF